MSRKAILALSLLTICTFGCDKSDKSKDIFGNCTSGYIAAYNEVSYAGRSLKSAAENNLGESTLKSRLDNLVRACNNLKTTYPGVSCKASVDGSEQTITTSSRESACARAEAVQKEYKSGATESREAIEKAALEDTDSTNQTSLL